MSDSRRVARVVLDSRLPQLNRLFDYLVPEGMTVEPGVRVKVPLRSAKRLAEGFVVGIEPRSDYAGKLAALDQVVSPVPVLPEPLWELAQAVASRSAGSPADVLRLAIPKRYVKVEKAWWREGAALGPAGVGTVSAPIGSQVSHEIVKQITQPAARSGLSLAYGVVDHPDGFSVPRSVSDLAHIAATTLSGGKSTIIVCPDWRDIEHFRSALSLLVPPERLVLLAGDQPPADRYGDYLKTLETTPLVVLGNRHAVYSPAPHLGLIIVVDDADQAHREPLAPYPHTRDVATVRNSIEGVAVCFAGLQPSLSVRRWIDMGYVEEFSVAGNSRPRVIPTALGIGADAVSSPARLPSSVFQATKEALAQGPVLVQVFRSGYSPGLSCGQCRSRATCVQCGGPLRKASPAAQPSCVWCGVTSGRWKCPECGGGDLRPRGQGIGRTVSDLGKSFPSVPVIRSDGEHVVSEVSSAPALVVATRGSEPLTPGGYSMVLLLDAAAMVQRDSLGATEESIHAWEHAISYAAEGGVCYVTDLDGPPAMALAAGNWSSFLRHELTQRVALKLPPSIRMASISGPPAEVEHIRAALVALSPHVDVLGPVALGTDGVLTVARFPYSLGDVVTAELGAWRQKFATGPRRSTEERVKIVLDDPGALDALAGE